MNQGETPVRGGSSGEGREHLHRGAMGVSDIVFFIVAAAAPLTAVAGGQAVAYLVTGNQGLPAVFLFYGIVLALFATGYATMSHYVTGAGAFYAYVARGLGRAAGLGTAFIALVAYNAMQIGIYGLYGVALTGYLNLKLGTSIDWWVVVLLTIGIIGVLGVLQIDLNAKVLGVVLAAEVFVVVLFDLAILTDPGPQGLTWSQFLPTTALEGGTLGAALVFGIASFVGFESAALYSEEARDPRRTVARATYIAVALVAIFYAVSSWLLAVAAGPATITSPERLAAEGYTTAGAPDPTTVLFIAGAERLGAWFADVGGLFFATSLFAALLSFHNAVARYIFALGRERVLPAFLSRVNPRTEAPYAASLTQTALALAIVAVFAVLGLDPVLTLFTWLTNTGALGVVALLSLLSFSVVAFFLSDGRGESRAKRLIAPLLAGAVLIVVLVLVVLNFNVLLTGDPAAPLDPLAVVLPAVVLGAGFVGLLTALFLRSRSPAVYAGIGEGGPAYRAEERTPGVESPPVPEEQR
ncbi:APC family permease [Rubrobacter taiwanensis]|jgi:amino acid transporter|nr:APC family permease [Rubrobacter taiwanensis]